MRGQQYSQVSNDNNQVIFDSGIADESTRHDDNLDNAFASSDDDESLSDWDDDRQVTSQAARRGDGYDRVTGENAPRTSQDDIVHDSAPSQSASPAHNNSFRSWFTAWRARKAATRSAPAQDGVFANLTEKPQVNSSAEDFPPSYEEAAADATPPYWETTIVAPGGYADEVFVDGLPVGNYFNLAWNMLVSVAFQFVGFFLTYLLHTSHAAKQGSRAGLGLTLIQYGYYLLPESSMSDSKDAPATDRLFEPENPNDFDISDFDGVSGSYKQGDSGEVYNTDSINDTSKSNQWAAIALMVIGWLVVVKALVDYARAKQMERAILRSSERAHEEAEAEALGETDSADPAPEHTNSGPQLRFVVL